MDGKGDFFQKNIKIKNGIYNRDITIGIFSGPFSVLNK
jgi:hypothetical protein